MWAVVSSSSLGSLSGTSPWDLCFWLQWSPSHLDRVYKVIRYCQTVRGKKKKQWTCRPRVTIWGLCYSRVLSLWLFTGPISRSLYESFTDPYINLKPRFKNSPLRVFLFYPEVIVAKLLQHNRKNICPSFSNRIAVIDPITHCHTVQQLLYPC